MLTRNILERVGKMVSARLGVLEEKLPPEKSFRPPLRADTSFRGKSLPPSKKAPTSSKPSGPSGGRTAPQGASYAATVAKKAGNAPKTVKAAAPTAKYPPAPKKAPESTEWTEVSRKRLGKKKREPTLPKAKATPPLHPCEIGGKRET